MTFQVQIPGGRQLVIHLDNLLEYLKSFCICKYCGGEREMEERFHHMLLQQPISS